ncbi:MAG: hypothetical protein KBF23_03815 [Agitococcus sp.]|nr:hypothetical protein [Moraxellaceae bacterium]MBP9216272.1 hypothetical protein [Agitococcus sp.]MBK7299520.1 hypothetical protein [Moraxellaceae bacterium]MBK9185273.1 hypothetical protein [Moraxellaceae bacterium]MBL0229348.1 hypothetical protein [Moraxellaceae bacterium]
MKLVLIIIGLCLSILSQTAMAIVEQVDMKLILDKNDIKIWSYRLPDSPYHGFKAVTTLKSSLTGAVAMVMDTQAANRWLYRTIAVEPIQLQNNNMDFLIRVVSDFPWPFKDREAIVKGKISQDSHSHCVTIESYSLDDYPIRDGYERMPKVEGGWLFRPLGNGRVEVTMTGHADLGGAVPAIIVNLLIQEHPYQSLLAMRKIIGESRFQSARLVDVKEPVM